MERCDIIVIGGGIAGIGCAAMLSEHATVRVIEAEGSPGYHATGRSAAIFIPSYGGREIRSLTAASERYLTEPPAELGIDCVLAPRGELLLAGEGEEEVLGSLLAECPSLQELEVDDALRLVPILRRENIRRACLEPRARDIDVDLLFQGWRRLLGGRGGAIASGHPVARLARGRDEWRVDTAHASYLAPVVVNAAGAWADDIARLAGSAPLALRACRRSAAILPAPGGREIADWPLFGSVAETWYAKPLGGKLMVSPADEDPVPPHDAFADDMVLAEGLHRYEQAVTVPVTRVEHSWAGLRTFAPDRVPVVGFDPIVDGFFWLAGQGGYGIQTAPALSLLACELISGHALSAARAELAAALSPRRFAGGPA